MQVLQFQHIQVLYVHACYAVTTDWDTEMEVIHVITSNYHNVFQAVHSNRPASPVFLKL